MILKDGVRVKEQDRAFTNKVVLVTGAARGQGRAHATRLAKLGANIIALDLCNSIATVPYPLATRDDLLETARQVRAEGAEVICVEADVRDFSAVEAGVHRGLKEFGRLDIVVANAGINGAFRQVEEVEEQAWNDVLDVNLKGVWHTCKAVIPTMKSQHEGGSIVLISSVAGFKGLENEAAYVASKHGIVGLMRTLARELAPHWIRVNSVHPTTVLTDMVCNDALYRLFRPDLENPTMNDARQLMLESHCLPTPWVECDDVTEAVVFLASDRARYITGVTLPVDAGAMLK